MENLETGRGMLLLRIAEQENRIKRQERLVANMGMKGLAEKEAEELLAVMRTTLGTLHTSLGYYER
jgi:hypothetical protein